jgi:(p)ppGpp synthase/HD superfamily hydrolase
MRYSYAIEQAIRAISVLHAGQIRKGHVPYPYITHLFAVAMIVADYTDDENVIVTALLHDTLTDTDYTEHELEDDFGRTIKDIVLSISEPPYTTNDLKNFTEQRKTFLKQLKTAPEEGLIVLAADTIHTMRSIIEDCISDHTAFIAEFGNTYDKQLLYYQELSNALNRRLHNSILTEFNNIFSEYKKFIQDVKTKSETY